MDPIVFSPSSLDLGVITRSDNPISANATIKNRSNSCLHVNLGKVESPGVWFTEIDESFNIQKKSGFDIFYSGKKIDQLVLEPHTQADLNIVVVSSQQSGPAPWTVKIPVSAYDGLPEEESEPHYNITVNLEINADVTESTFRIIPSQLFISDCFKGQTVTKEIVLQSLSGVSLPIIIDSLSFFDISTNFVEIPPRGQIKLTLKHTPQEIGQFEQQISFNSLIYPSTPQYLSLLTSVSPSVIPPDLPTLSPPLSLDFGEIYAGHRYEMPLTLTNPGDQPYPISLSSFSGTQNAPPSRRPSSLSAASPTAEVFFKTAASPRENQKFEAVLEPRGVLTVFVSFSPLYVTTADPAVFDHRQFLITLSIGGHYRLIECTARVCHSRISISPESLVYGDAIVVNSARHSTISLTNLSPMSTKVSLSTSARSISVPSVPLEIPAHSTITTTITFYPRKVNPEYQSEINVSNLSAAGNNPRIPVTAIVVAGQAEALHSALYSLSPSSLDFQKCASSFPSLKTLTIKNKQNNMLTLKLTTPPSIRVYKQITDSDVYDGGLLRKDSPPLSLKELEKATRGNSAFFNDVYTLLHKYNDSDVYDHFENQLRLFKTGIQNSEDVTDIEFSVPPSGRIDLIVVLTAETLSTSPQLWRRFDTEIQIFCGATVHRSLSVTSSVASSTLFMSSRSLAFGNVLCGSRTRRTFSIGNESALPLLLRVTSNQPVSVDEKPSAVVPPLDSVNFPFTLAPELSGKIRTPIVVKNLLSPSLSEISISATAVRRTAFYLHPQEIDFEVLQPGTASHPLSLFIANTSDSDATFVVAHNPRQRQTSATLQLKSPPVQTLAEAVQIQVERLRQKVRILERKQRTDRAAQINSVIEALLAREGGLVRKSQQSGKAMDRVSFTADPLEHCCVEVKLVPSVLSGTGMIEGVFSVCEKGRPDSIKYVKYRARVSGGKLPLNFFEKPPFDITPDLIDLGNIYVLENSKGVVELTDTSGKGFSYWVSADSNEDAVVSAEEGLVREGETKSVTIDVFPLRPGIAQKTVSFIVGGSASKVQIRYVAQYKPIVRVSHASLDFGKIALTALMAVEERASFSIFNLTEGTLFAIVRNPSQSLLVYESDPRVPVARPILLEPNGGTGMNVILCPQIDRESYRRFKTLEVYEDLKIEVYNSEEEATRGIAILYATEVKVSAIVGRIGMSLSESEVYFGLVPSGTRVKAPVSLKNRAAHIDLHVTTACSQGVSVDPAGFDLPAKGTQEVDIEVNTGTGGIVEGEVVFGAGQIERAVRVKAFVDSRVIDVSLPRSDNGIPKLDLGFVYVVDGVPIKKTTNFNITCIGNGQRFAVDALNLVFFLSKGGSRNIEFTYPFTAVKGTGNSPFSEQLIIKSHSTGTVVSLIDIVGEFVISTATVTPEKVVFPRFGEVNQWRCPTELIEFRNISSAPLTIETLSASKYAIIDKLIGPIEPQKSVKVEVAPNIDALRKIEGQTVTVLRFRNMQNPLNILKVSLSFDIRSAFLRLFHVEGDLSGPVVELSKFVDVEGSLVATGWFGAVNCFDSECEVDVSIEVKGDIEIELFQRDSEMKLTNFILQANERAEARVRARVRGDNFQWLNELKDPIIACLVCTTANAEPLYIGIAYKPKNL